MATSSPQLDPLLALRSTLSSSKSITLLSSSQIEVYTLSEASHISFPHLPSSPSYARSTLTRLSAGTNPNLSDPSTPYYDLQTLLFFYLHRDAKPGEYLKSARTQGVGFVSSIDRKLVVEYLGGKGEAQGRLRPLNEEELQVVKRDLPDQLNEGEGGVKSVENENGQKEDTSASAGVGSKGEGGQPPMKKARYTANKEDQDKVKKMLSIIQGPQYGHVLAPTEGKGGKEGTVTADKVGGAWHSRETVLRGERYNNFDSVRSLIQPRLQTLQSASNSSSSKPSTSSSSSKPGQSAVASSKKKQLNPIIMISPSSTALLTMHNIKPFLEDSKFIPSDQARSLAAGASTGYVAEDVIQVNHSRASGGSSGQTIETRKARYFVVDSVEALAKFGGAGRVDEAWERVVCVMTTGQEWQFKPYKWKEPKELFHHVKGVYPQWSTDAPNAKMKSWNVSDLRIDPHKRHVDKSVAADFWRSLETWIAREKPWLSY